MSLDRRTFLQLTAALQAAALLGMDRASAAEAAPPLRFGKPEPFSYEQLKALAKQKAATDYVPPPRPNPDIVRQIDYDAHGKLRYKLESALWASGGSVYPISFQHVGMYFPKTVRMHMVEKGAAREVLYDPELFMGGPNHVARKLPPEPSAFAGFWIHESNKSDGWKKAEPWATFLGASYFRAVGELGQVGLSARGLAIGPGTANPEEFPDFTSFWFEPAENDDAPVIVNALLESPSVAGAYRFALKRTKGVVMDIEAAVFLRKPLERMGIAPLTSMFWFSETKKATAVDWRPEVHDSDGLAMWTGTGEHIWRPLNNPGQITVSSFSDQQPRGYGLLQRDRNFDHFQDGVRYQLRPSAWVEPLGDWGKGVIQLTEIPTDDEIHDNIVAMWVPAEPAKAGASFDLSYRLHWLADEPYPTSLARCVATRLGNGGQPGQPRPQGVRKFMIEFQGTQLAKLPFGEKPEAVLWASRGSFSYVFTEPVPDDVPGHWRAQFDLTVDGKEPVEMRLFLRNGTEILSETWLYQYHPI
jgi:periplasmic glucans biosynthesis protein